MHQLKTEQL